MKGPNLSQHKIFPFVYKCLVIDRNPKPTDHIAHNLIVQKQSGQATIYEYYNRARTQTIQAIAELIYFLNGLMFRSE